MRFSRFESRNELIIQLGISSTVSNEKKKERKKKESTNLEGRGR